MMEAAELNSLELMQVLKMRVWKIGREDLRDEEEYLLLRRRTYLVVGELLFRGKFLARRSPSELPPEMAENRQIRIV